MSKTKRGKPGIFNISNLLCYLRIILSPVIVLLIILKYDFWIAVALFIAAMLTDFIDGFIARKYGLMTEFGRKLDIVADRILMISAALAFLAYMTVNGLLTKYNLVLMLIIMSREIISAPFWLASFFIKGGKSIPHARLSGKVTTFLQGITFPMIAFDLGIAVYFAVVTCITGLVAGISYSHDLTGKSL